MKQGWTNTATLFYKLCFRGKSFVSVFQDIFLVLHLVLINNVLCIPKSHSRCGTLFEVFCMHIVYCIHFSVYFILSFIPCGIPHIVYGFGTQLVHWWWTKQTNKYKHRPLVGQGHTSSVHFHSFL